MRQAGEWQVVAGRGGFKGVPETQRSKEMEGFWRVAVVQL